MGQGSASSPGKETASCCSQAHASTPAAGASRGTLELTWGAGAPEGASGVMRTRVDGPGAVTGRSTVAAASSFPRAAAAPGVARAPAPAGDAAAAPALAPDDPLPPPSRKPPPTAAWLALPPMGDAGLREATAPGARAGDGARRLSAMAVRVSSSSPGFMARTAASSSAVAVRDGDGASREAEEEEEEEEGGAPPWPKDARSAD
mmetsp:Transcript_8496/g.33566  ORF Transcript_8496/g.33566 Transcript_8496/m.33566 type:complete len:204 (-) Transcript_8496:381-992(-)